jgi:hypothetical protein
VDKLVLLQLLPVHMLRCFILLVDSRCERLRQKGYKELAGHTLH